METVGPEGRTTMGMLYQCFFAVGFMLLPGIAYFVNNWRNLQLCISIPSILLLLYYWVLPESPRWLMMQGRFEEAVKILKNIAKTNRSSMPPREELDALRDSFEFERKKSEEIEESLLKKFINFFRSIITLLSTRNIRRRCLIIFFAWFVVSMVYYGLTFSGGNINASPYLLVFLSGLVEIPSYFLVCWTLKKFGRRLNLCMLFTICGTACLLILAVPKEMVWLNMTLATVGKFFNSAAFAVSYIYSAELVPTGVRNIAVGTSSMCARIGSAIAPFIVDLLDSPDGVLAVLDSRAVVLTSAEVGGSAYSLGHLEDAHSAPPSPPKDVSHIPDTPGPPPHFQNLTEHNAGNTYACILTTSKRLWCFEDTDYVGELGIATGWGRISEKGEPTDTLKEALVPIFPNAVCQALRYRPYEITDNMFCAGYINGGTDSCHGDSGGGLMWEGSDGKMDVVGVVSWGQGCGRHGYPGVYTRVTRYLDWIHHHTRDSCYCGRRRGKLPGNLLGG